MYCDGRSLQGPHTSCLMTSETYLSPKSRRRTVSKPLVNLNCYVRTSLGTKQCAFNLYFTTGLLICVLFIVLVVFVLLYFLLANSFIRFQQKFLLLCISFHIHVFSFRSFTTYMVFSVRVLMIILGAVGHLVTIFIKM